MTMKKESRLSTVFLFVRTDGVRIRRNPSYCVRTRFVSPSELVARQESYRDDVIGEVLFGFDRFGWEEGDYVEYLSGNPELFERDSNDSRFFRLFGGDPFSKIPVLDFAVADDVSKAVSLSLLVRGAYSPTLLRKFGFVR